MSDDETQPRRERARQAAASGIQRVRDRRRRVRNRLEDIFGRKTFTAVVVGGAMAKLIETGVVPVLDPGSAAELGRVFAWFVVFTAAVLVSVYWEHLAAAAAEAADTAEETVDPDS